MNRRSFIKTITGIVSGIVAAFVPKAKGLTVKDVKKCRDELKKAADWTPEDWGEAHNNTVAEINEEFEEVISVSDAFVKLYKANIKKLSEQSKLKKPV